MSPAGGKRARVLGFLAAALLLLLVAPGLLVRWRGRSFMYHPTALDARDLADLASRPGWAPARLPVAPGVELVGLLHAARDERAPYLLFFGGNASDLDGNQHPFLRLVREPDEDLGYATFAYRGFDGSGGSPSEAALLGDARAAAEWLFTAQQVRPERLVVMGQSLGSGVAAALAAALSREGRPPRALILLSPYTSMAQVFADHIPLAPVKWAVVDRYATDELLTQVRAPILLLHGRRDSLIHLRHSQALAALVPRAELVELEAAGHNNLWQQPELVRAIRRALALDPAIPPP